MNKNANALECVLQWLKDQKWLGDIKCDIEDYRESELMSISIHCKLDENRYDDYPLIMLQIDKSHLFFLARQKLRADNGDIDVHPSKDIHDPDLFAWLERKILLEMRRFLRPFVAASKKVDILMNTIA